MWYHLQQKINYFFNFNNLINNSTLKYTYENPTTFVFPLFLIVVVTLKISSLICFYPFDVFFLKKIMIIRSVHKILNGIMPDGLNPFYCHPYVSFFFFSFLAKELKKIWNWCSLSNCVTNNSWIEWISFPYCNFCLLFLECELFFLIFFLSFSLLYWSFVSTFFPFTFVFLYYFSKIRMKHKYRNRSIS